MGVYRKIGLGSEGWMLADQPFDGWRKATRYEWLWYQITRDRFSIPETTVLLIAISMVLTWGWPLWAEIAFILGANFSYYFLKTATRPR